MNHIFVLGDQLTRHVGPLADANPEYTSVLMLESLALAKSVPHHKQKLVMVWSAMRHFAEALEEDGFSVSYQIADSFEEGLGAYFQEYPGASLTAMQPNDYGFDTYLEEAVAACGGTLTLEPNALWLVSDTEFDDWAIDRKTLRMEYFYRSVREKMGWLMEEDGQPTGGKWNFDKENRRPPKEGHDYPEPLNFEPDEVTQEVIQFVNETFPNHFGTTDGFDWAVTREQALEALEDFCENRLRDFGPFEDAMVEGERVLYHSLLSAPLKLGLLHPKEVCERALSYAADGRRKIPLNSIEGFIRQVSGWREFMHQVYRFKMPEFRDQNKLDHQRDVPEFFWSGDTQMNCLRDTVTQLRETGHTHHIQRLMVLGNFALIAGVNPQRLTDWFTACYIDAQEWVMVPNVIGMSQYADLGSFTTKPYAASANYIKKMSNYCKGCAYKPKETTGEQACPFNSLYWDFLDRHKERFGSNPRMSLVMANWDKRGEETRGEILARAQEVVERLESGAL